MKKIYTKLECEVMLWNMDVVTASGDGETEYGYDPDGIGNGPADKWSW